MGAARISTKPYSWTSHAELLISGRADSDAPKGWPAEGRVEVKNVWMRYAPQQPPVLKGLTLTINPMEKVGIAAVHGAHRGSSRESDPSFTAVWRKGNN